MVDSLGDSGAVLINRHDSAFSIMRLYQPLPQEVKSNPYLVSHPLNQITGGIMKKVLYINPEDFDSC